MIPFIYDADATQFATGIPSVIYGSIGAITDCTFCEVTEERNGIFECEFRYPVNGPMFKKIRPGSIIYVTYDVSGTKEPFDIYAFNVDITGLATYRARHISYRLNNIVYQPGFKHQGWMNAASPLWNLPDYLTDQTTYRTHLNKLPYNIPFTIQQVGFTTSDKKWYLIYENSKSLREVLIGASKSITAQGGVEMRWRYDNGRIYGDMMKQRGTDTTAVIRFGANLNGLRYEYDESDYAESVVPYVIDSDGNALLLENLTSEQGLYPDYIGVPGQYKYNDRFVAVLVDFSSEFDGTPNADELEAKAREYYNTHCLKGAYENLTIDFQPLWQSPEYSRNIAPAEKLKLCDTAQVFVPELGINKRMKVCKTVWNVLEERYTRLEFGSSQRTIYTVNYDNGTAEETDEGTVIIVDEDIPVGE